MSVHNDPDNPGEIARICQNIQSSLDLGHHPPVGDIVPNTLDKIAILREEMATLDERIISQLSHIDALDEEPGEAEIAYFSLKEERQRLLEDINSLLSNHRKPVLLPIEVILKILSYAKNHNTLYGVWGDTIFAAINLVYKFKDLLDDKKRNAIRKCSNVEIRDEVNDEVSAKRVRFLLGQWIVHIGKWKEFTLGTTSHAILTIHESLLEVLRACGSSLGSVVALRVTISYDRSDTNLHLRSPWHDKLHQCKGCLSSRLAPACTELSLPLRMLPCFRKVHTERIRHLALDLRDNLALNYKFYFRYFDIKNLQSLTLCWGYPGGHDTIPSMVSPNLRRLTFYIANTQESGTAVLTMLKSFECAHLECLELFDGYTGQGMVRPNTPFQERPLPDGFMEEIGERFGTLTKLTVHFCMINLHGGFKVASRILGDLQVQNDERILLPRLSYLALNHPGKDFKQLEDGLRLVKKRGKFGSSIQTIRLIIGNYAPLTPMQQLQIDRLGLLVKNVVISRFSNHWACEEEVPL